MVAEIWASVISSFVDQLVALNHSEIYRYCHVNGNRKHFASHSTTQQNQPLTSNDDPDPLRNFTRYFLFFAILRSFGVPDVCPLAVTRHTPLRLP